MSETRTRRPSSMTGSRWPLFVVTLLLALLTAAPILLMITGAFKDAGSVFDGALWAKNPTWENFAYVFSTVPFARYLGNSFLLAVVVTVCSMAFHSMAAFALARLEFPGRDKIFFAFFSTILVSMPMIIVPLFLVVKELGLLNTLPGVAAPMIFQGFALFLLRQFYLSLPRELEESARLDGCGPFGLFLRIALPLSRPILAALAIFVFLGAWNAFLWPLTTTSDESQWVVQVGISALQGEHAGAWNYILAGATLATVPTVGLFLVFQRQIIESIKTTGLK